MAEALNGTFKAEPIDRQNWRDRDHVERALVRWIGWYNNQRLHGQIGHVPPAEHDPLYNSAITTPQAA